MQDEAAICLVLPVLRSANGVPVVATPKVAKVAKMGFGWPKAQKLSQNKMETEM